MSFISNKVGHLDLKENYLLVRFIYDKFSNVVKVEEVLGVYSLVPDLFQNIINALLISLRQECL